MNAHVKFELSYGIKW